MARLKSSSALLALGIAASACTGSGYGLSPHHNPTMTSVNQPVVQRTDYVFDVAAAGGVPASEQERLAAWFDTIDVGYGDRVSIDSGGAYADAASRADVAGIAASRGLLLSEGAPVTAGNVQPGSIRVIVSRSAAVVPGCPIWDATEVGARHTTSPKNGCAVNSNLAAMIADPNDLVLGQEGSLDGDAATASKAIKTYREKAPTGAGPLKAEKTDSN